MTGEELLDSMEYIDAVWVEKAENPAPKQRMRKGWIGAIAACLAVVIGVYLFLPNRVLVFTPWQIADLMLGEGEIAGDTQHYMTIDLGKNQELLLAPLPDSEYVPVFYKNKTKLPEGENMMKAWLWPIMYRLKDSLGVETLDGYDLLTDQGRYNQYYSFVIEKSRKDQYGNCDIWLDGELISVTPAKAMKRFWRRWNLRRKSYSIFAARNFRMPWSFAGKEIIIAIPPISYIMINRHTH